MQEPSLLSPIRDNISQELFINQKYEYEDNDINILLELKARQLVKTSHTIVNVLAALNNVFLDQITSSIKSHINELKKNAKDLSSNNQLLIPYNLGNYHWVGIIILLNDTLNPSEIFWCDPLKLEIKNTLKLRNKLSEKLKSKNDYELVEEMLKKIWPMANIQTIDLLKQSDATSCGVVTIENLIALASKNLEKKVLTEEEIKKLRQQHLELVREKNPKYFEKFYLRQRDNRPTVANLPEQIRLLTKKVKFSPQELNRIMKGYQIILTIESDKITQIIKNCLRDKESYKDGVREYLNQIRQGINQILSQSLTPKTKKCVDELLNIFFGFEPGDIELKDISDCTFIVGHEELRAIDKLLQGKNIDFEQVSKSIFDQIQADEIIAKSLQAKEDGFYSSSESTTSLQTRMGLNPRLKESSQQALPKTISTIKPHCDHSSAMVGREPLYKIDDVKKWLEHLIPKDIKLGSAISKGDCFFDAIAQGLNQLTGKEDYNAKSIRLLCEEYTKNSNNKWVAAANKRMREDHNAYLVRIGLTAQEIEDRETQGLKLGTAIWGRPKIEGKMICEKIGIRLHVIEIQEDGKVIRVLVDADGEQEINPNINYYDESIIHLVNYHNHYVPLIRGNFLKKDEQHPLKRFAENHRQKGDETSDAKSNSSEEEKKSPASKKRFTSSSEEEKKPPAFKKPFTSSSEEEKKASAPKRHLTSSSEEEKKASVPKRHLTSSSEEEKKASAPKRHLTSSTEEEKKAPALREHLTSLYQQHDGLAKKKVMQEKDKLVEIIFKGVLKKLAESNLSSKSPRIFLIYAYNNQKYNNKKADDEIAKEIINWLHGELGLNLYSDLTPYGNKKYPKTVQETQLKTDILKSQLCLLPKVRDSVDIIILCGSELLKFYTEMDEYSTYYEKLIDALSRGKAGAEYASVQRITSHYSKKSYFHQVITELVFLNMRIIEEGQYTVIPIILNGERSTEALPHFITRTDVCIEDTKWRKHGNWQGKEVFTNQGLYLGFFKILERLFATKPEQYELIQIYKKKFEESIEAIRRDEIDQDKIKIWLNKLDQNKRKIKDQYALDVFSFMEEGLKDKKSVKATKLSGSNEMKSIGVSENILIKEYLIPANKLSRQKIISISKSGEVVNGYQKRKIIKDLDQQFIENHILAIIGIAGAGKTQLVSYYIENFWKKRHLYLARKFRSSTIQELNEDLRQFASDIFAASNKVMDLQNDRDIRNVIISWLTYAEGFLLFFDNLYDTSLINDFISLRSESKNIIITTQDGNILEKEQRFLLDGFTEDESYLLLRDIIKDRKEARMFASKFSYLPLGLVCAKLYILSCNKTISASQYLDLIENDKYRLLIEKEENSLMMSTYQDKSEGYRNQLSACLLAIMALNESAKSIVKKCAFFAADTIIPEKLLKDLISENDSPVGLHIRLSHGITNLNKYSLAIISTKNNNIGFHSVVQKASRLYIRDENRNTIKQILNCLAQYCNNLIKNNGLNDFFDINFFDLIDIALHVFKDLGELIIHIEKLLEYTVEIESEELTVILLMNILAQYYTNYNNSDSVKKYGDKAIDLINKVKSSDERYEKICIQSYYTKALIMYYSKTENSISLAINEITSVINKVNKLYGENSHISLLCQEKSLRYQIRATIINKNNPVAQNELLEARMHLKQLIKNIPQQNINGKMDYSMIKGIASGDLAQTLIHLAKMIPEKLDEFLKEALTRLKDARKHYVIKNTDIIHPWICQMYIKIYLNPKRENYHQELSKAEKYCKKYLEIYNNPKINKIIAPKISAHAFYYCALFGAAKKDKQSFYQNRDKYHDLVHKHKESLKSQFRKLERLTKELEQNDAEDKTSFSY